VVVTLAPQMLAGPIYRAECEVAERVLIDRLRENDRYCMLADGSFVVVLAAIDEMDALVVAQRLASEVTLRVRGVNARKWQTQLASIPRDPLIDAAVQRATRMGSRGLLKK
jgi:hypothetical protein